MKRSLLVLALVLATAASAATIASARGGQAVAHASRVTRVNVHRTGLGTILVSSSGATLYEFTRDRGHNSCVKVSGCAEVWPALTSGGRPTAGSGVRASLLSTVKLPNGSQQVTYAGHPLYIYASEPKGTSYVGVNAFGGSWDAINGAGHAVK